jgi:hypothetical protein
MKAKRFLQIIAALMISAAMATTTIAAGKVNPEAVSKGMLTALSRRSQCCTFVYEPFQQCVYGNALPPGFISKTCFDLSRNLGSASAVSPPSVAALSNSSSRRLDHHPA